MYNEKQLIYQLNGKALEKIIREIIQSEFKILEERLKREPKVLSRQDAAKYIGVSPNTISEYVKQGLIPNRGLGRRINILESDLTKIPKKHGFNYKTLQ